MAFVTAVLTLSGASAAEASPCRGEAPEVGAIFRGPVLHVFDGARLCVARGESPDQWVELQLADAPEHSARGALMATAFAQDVDCKVTAADPAAPKAVCTLNGRSIGRLVGKPTLVKAGRAWR
jgi:hypothetical protein